MGNSILHITNGDSLTSRLENLNLKGDIIVWREMLCEGPTPVIVGSKEFIEQRKEFLKKQYHIDNVDYENKFVSELNKLAVINNYDKIVLWFEFDLFCHVNMLAALSYLIQNKKTAPIYMVCSGWVKGLAQLKGLSELNDEQLAMHYDNKLKLSTEDLELAHHIWKLYCDEKPIELKAEISKKSNFNYLSSCIRAHIERFPNINTGLNTLETNILKLIDLHEITSEHQLCGYALNYQGYYGYGDTQIISMIKNLRPFFMLKEGVLMLTEKGLQVLQGSEDFYNVLKTDMQFGGTAKYKYRYDPANHKLIKHSENATPTL
ncbi:DUF1835 domain-containing protein [Leeuwenhoekiella sp. MAR_2009_132]|uniref:DUF1835 domain-containing protein n=1 Tax=Leeuwenhoekiella sp. MAR_2009_132 TaxID=1392489 RepID=UPI0004907F2D|nr:DUF1835 domain-containing protein [Leeuwenhoekiella sp. MAR_2009_132]